ncbi:non-ribosomal peptide synthetase component F [Methylobacterium sp. BE186]|uniref:AMP-binding protein n=1 Tax=Methylobacterium sp. BE186 TaxID=2817715 RepID=UPI0028626EC7|nr:AMP-binding protein [Methylobacterium sp. BE186]MDR7035653.1 non-ribosomal peptide synthetase component F [Methylobacterium sp. BE186]
MPLRRTGLCALLAATARRHPARVALLDAADKAAWSGRPAMTWTYGAAAEIVSRLACGLRAWPLPPGSRIGLALPGSTEGLVAHLAVEAAGHVPCLLPATWDEDQLAAGIEAAALSAVLTQTRLGESRPAERLCRAAARYFGLRYLAAFGPDVPDGVINLDEMVLDRRAGPVAADTGGGLISFANGDPARPVHRPGDALLAAVAVHLVATRIGPGERILSLVPPGDLRGVVTGLGAALVAGASLETLPVFDGAALAAALLRPVPTHLVVPAFLEPALAQGALPPTLRTIGFAHRAPTRLTGRNPRLAFAKGRVAVTDVLAVDEDFVITGARGLDDLAFGLAEPAHLGCPESLLALRLEADGRLACRGQAAKAAPVRRGEETGLDGTAWRPTRFRPTLFAGTATGLTDA